MLSDINLTYIVHDFVANLVRYIYDLFIYLFPPNITEIAQHLT